MRKAFTLIELLIVVAIIAILAAIAVPNFLEAQARSKVSRAKADLRSIGTSLESYALDHGKYPLWPKKSDGNWPAYPDYPTQQDPFIGFTPPLLTTPVAYMTSLPKEVFTWNRTGKQPKAQNFLNLFRYDSEANWDSYYGMEPGKGGSWAWNAGSAFKWAMLSIGPDGNTNVEGDNGYGPTNNLVEIFHKADTMGTNMYYNPTNGTVSRGDIIYVGPSGGFDFAGNDAWR